jgi:catechol 2,3-dioxygenase-like lactoylglutathione lyase family enzyme
VKIERLDHVVLTVSDMSSTINFYERVLGMRHVIFDDHYNALHFGDQKINLHPYRAEYKPHAYLPAPGTADVCFIGVGSIEDVVAHLKREGVSIEVGPVDQTGAMGSMRSVYFRDPDRNLIEVACYTSKDHR